MRYKCFTCGTEFDDIQQLASHKRMHSSSERPKEKPGVICLGCGRQIPIDASKANYTGPLTCPTCRRTMKVTLQDGEVVVARLG